VRDGEKGIRGVSTRVPSIYLERSNKMSNSVVTVKHLCDLFFEEMVSQYTHEKDRNKARNYFRTTFLQYFGPNTHIEDLTMADLEGYLTQVRSTPVKGKGGTELPKESFVYYCHQKNMNSCFYLAVRKGFKLHPSLMTRYPLNRAFVSQKRMIFKPNSSLQKVARKKSYLPTQTSKHQFPWF